MAVRKPGSPDWPLAPGPVRPPALQKLLDSAPSALSCSELDLALPLNVLVVAATGKLGSVVTRLSIEANHTVSVFVRDKTMIDTKLRKKVRKKIKTVHEGDAIDAASMAHAVKGQDVVIECLGNSQRADAITVLVEAVATARCGALITMGGTPALLLPSGAPAGPALGMQTMADLHLHTLGLLRKASGVTAGSTVELAARSNGDGVKQPTLKAAWTQVCPSRMVKSHDKKPSGFFFLQKDVCDVEVYREKKDLTYEDVATAIVNLCHLEASGFNHHQVAFALVEKSSEGRHLN